MPTREHNPLEDIPLLLYLVDLLGVGGQELQPEPAPVAFGNAGDGVRLVGDALSRISRILVWMRIIILRNHLSVAEL